MVGEHVETTVTVIHIRTTELSLTGSQSVQSLQDGQDWRIQSSILDKV